MGTSEIADNTVGAADIAPNAVGLSEMADNAVGSAEIVDNSVTAADIAANAVGLSEMADNAVGSAEIVNNSVTAADIAADAVGASKLIETDDYTVDELYVTTKQGIGTTTVPHGGIGWGLLALDGPEASINGPHIQLTTYTDDYPVWTVGGWGHDAANLRFDCYWDGTDQKSSDEGSNLMLIKWDDKYLIRYQHGIAAGESFNFYTAMSIDLTDGSVKLPAVYDDTVGGTYRDLYIDNTGRLGYLSSSARYKDNIRAAASADTGWIYGLRPVMFDYKDPGAGTNQCGLIAEEVAAVHPDIVSYKRELTFVDAGPSEKDPTNQAGDTLPVIKTTDVPETVNYSKLVVPMLAEIQRLKAQVDALEARLAVVEAGR